MNNRLLLNKINILKHMLGEEFPTPKHVINKDLEEIVTSSYEFEEGNLAHPVLATWLKDDLCVETV